MSVYSVNGKEPIAAWIPSLDTAGNGTTTLNDLIGSNHGTLTNFALTGSASNWVPDTSNGGVRALDFDGSNDYVTVPHASVLNPGSNPFSVSVWIKPPNSNQFGPIFQKRMSDNSITQLFAMSVAGDGLTGASGKKVNMQIFWNSVSIARTAYTTADVADGNWHHVVGVWTGSAIQIWVDGTSRSLTFDYSAGTPASAVNPTGALRIGNNVPGANHFSGRQDDLRLYHGFALDSSDVAYLCNSAAGRGRVASLGESRRRRQSVSGGVL